MSVEGSPLPALQLRRQEPKSAFTQWKRRTVWVVLAVIAGYFLVTCLEIVWQSRRDEAQPADVIVVFGAAEYSGHPSPVFRARLDHAVTLYSRGLAPYLIITGGAGGDPQFSEGGVGRDYLATRGISERQLIAETQGDNTAESAERVAVIMRTNNMRTCIAVSDPYHLYRIKKLMQGQGITTYTSPRPDASRRLWFNVKRVMREASSYLTWRLRPS
jgi:uncharacterized SAM-binding protein YcdF (DUF218 family)